MFDAHDIVKGYGYTTRATMNMSHIIRLCIVFKNPRTGHFSTLYFNIPNIEVHFFRYPLSDIPRLYVSCYGLCAARLPVSEAIP